MENLFIIAVCLFVFTSATAQVLEYKIITTVESIMPLGLGRSRILEATEANGIFVTQHVFARPKI